MMPLFLHVSILLTAACVAGLWQGLGMVLMGVALCGLMPRASASLRHAVLIALFAGALFLPFIRFHGVDGGSGQHGFRLAPWVGAAIAAIWFAAAAFRGVQLYLAWRHLCAVRRAAVAVQVQGAAVFAAGTRRAILCSSPDVDSPTILGFRSPRLLLPDWMVPRLSESELQQIALHECEHLRRGDDWMNLLLQVGLILSPLNPALFWLNRIIGVQRELAVDAAVVAQTAKPLAYAACLTRLAEQRLERGRLRLALSAWERKSELVQRVHALLEQSSVWTRAQSAWATAAAAAVLLTAAIGMARVPQLVHVADVPMQVATTQSPVTAPPATAIQSGLREATFTAPRMEPASFHVQPARFVKVHAMRKKTSRKITNSSTDSRASAIPQPNYAPFMMRTRYTPSRDVSTAREDSAQMATEPVQLTPALFSSPYVAVPMANGWLLIEL
jgi:beta-lactamase regulating signal transducer with metallopeptidase domain